MNTQNVKFNASAGECKVIIALAKRAREMAALNSIDLDHLSIAMDIEAVHCNCCPLRLVELAAADDFNFAHDVFGIRRHLNRETGLLNNHFRPRFAESDTRSEVAARLVC